MKKEVKLGIFVLAALAMAGYFVIKTKSFVELFSKGTRFPVVARFHTVAGLYPSAPVMLAGVDIGVVSSIKLEGREAVARLEIDKNVQLNDDARAIISTIGIVGEKYVEIVYKDEFKKPDPHPIVANGEILTLEPFNLDELKVKFDNLYEHLHQAIGEMADLLGDPRLRKGITDTADNLALLTRDLRTLTAPGGPLPTSVARFSEVALRLQATTDELGRAVAQVSRTLAPAEGQGTLAKADALVARLGEAATDLREVARRLRGGEGTAGKILGDEELYRKIDQSVTQARDFMADLTRKKDNLTKSSLHAAAGAEYFASQRKTRALLDVELNINNTILRGSAAEDPRGGSPLFSAQAGRSLGAVTVTAGVIESHLGAGFSLDLAPRKVVLRSHVSQFNRAGSPFARSTLEFNLARHIRLTTGVTDLFRRDRRELFLGLSLQTAP
jgi:phospholipid/cholesterol/gamma-HCH transport system substrate-binding protein